MAVAARKLRFRLVDASRQSANANPPRSLLVPFILPHDASKFFYPQNSVVKGGRKSQASGCFRTPGHQMLLSRDEIRISGALNTHGFPEVSNR